MVPVAIQTLATYGKTRTLSNPSILVNDNQTANLISEREVPFSASSQGTSTTITSQGGTASAGTVLEVTPRISEGGDITIQFDVELSSFIGASVGGLQPPAQRDQYTSWVTLPSDSTIVVGGFRLNTQDKQERKVPLLGDIPLIGALFKSYTEDLSDSVIFVFITPKIMRDPSGADLLLITEGPLAEVGLEPDIPFLEPALMPIVGSLGAEERLIRNNAAADLGAANAENDG
jgi:type II secretory pathway component GspD/PulD (secretin)